MVFGNCSVTFSCSPPLYIEPMKVLLCGKEEAYLVPSATALLPFCSAQALPLDRAIQEIARPTRGAALALRAKVLLYAASPLMNGQTPADIASELVDDQGNRLLPEAYDESKWAKAAAAAKDVIELNRYTLFVSYATDKGDIAFLREVPGCPKRRW